MGLSQITKKRAGVFVELERQRRFMESLREPAVVRNVRLYRERQEQLYRNLMEPAGVRALTTQQEQMRKVLRSPVLDQLERQRKQLDELLRGPQIIRTLAAGYGALPSGLVEQVREYGDDFADEIADEAEAASEPVEVLDRGLSRIAAEREAIVLALGRTSKILGGMYLGGIAIPRVVVILVLVFAVLGEVADEVLVERENRAREDG